MSSKSFQNASKLNGIVSVLEFGADPTGATNSTLQINAAIAAGTGKCIHFPAGTYLYSGGGVLGAGSVISGDGRNATIIRSALSSPTDGYLIKAAGYGSGLVSLRFDAAVTQTGGSYVWLSGIESFINDFFMNGDFNGIWMTGNVSRIRHGRFQDGAANAIRIKAEGGDNSQLIDDVLMGAQLPQISFAGIRVRNSSALIISNTSVIQQGHGLLIDPTTLTTGANPADGNVLSLYVNNCFFDNSSGNGIRITPSGTGSVVRCRFANCWAGSSGNDGIYLNNTGSGILQGMHFESCHAVLNGTSGSGAGFSTLGDVQDFTINGGIIASNTQGVYLGSGTVNSKICNATIGLGGGLSGNTGNGVTLLSGTFNTIVTGNTIINNTGTGVTVNGTADRYIIANNFIFGNGTNLFVTQTADRVVKNNTGVISPDIASGSSFIPSGGTSVVINHDLGVIPDPAFIQISPTNSFGSNPLFVDTTTITASQFTVKAASAVVGTHNFTWNARINNK